MAKHPIGIYVPAYWGTWSSELNYWHELLYKYVVWNPDIEFVIAINPNSGYGFDQALVNWSYLYRQAGAKVLGYFSVNYGTQNQRPSGAWGTVTWPHTSLPYMKQQVDLYVRDYWVDGFMYDDHPSVTHDARDTFGQLSWDTSRTTLQTMTELTNYARNALARAGRQSFIKANVGVKPAAEYYWMYDNINVWEALNSYPDYNAMINSTYGGYYNYAATITVHHTWWQTPNPLDKISYRMKYFCVHESEFHSLSYMLPNMIQWCRNHY